MLGTYSVEPLEFPTTIIQNNCLHQRAVRRLNRGAAGFLLDYPACGGLSPSPPYDRRSAQNCRGTQCDIGPSGNEYLVPGKYYLRPQAQLVASPRVQRGGCRCVRSLSGTSGQVIVYLSNPSDTRLLCDVAGQEFEATAVGEGGGGGGPRSQQLAAHSCS